MSTSSATERRSSPAADLFQIPHSRMKELVEAHLTKVREIKSFSVAPEDLLQAVYEAMWELKSHEYIENHFIMDRLKERLQAKRVYNQLVCNCHEDSKLLYVISQVERVYTAPSEAERQREGHLLQDAIRIFLDEFVAHMDEEEKIFTPLLTENFETKELADMSEMVMKQHSLFRAKVKSEKSLKAVKRKRSTDDYDDVLGIVKSASEFEFSLEQIKFRKTYCEEVDEMTAVSAKKAKNDDTKRRENEPRGAVALKDESPGASTSAPIDVGHAFHSALLPDEIMIKILGLLGPKDLLRLARTSHGFHRLVFTPKLWRRVLPTQWARGKWSFQPEVVADDHRKGEPTSSLASLASSTDSLNSLLSSSDSSVEDAAQLSSSGSHFFTRFIATTSRESRVFSGVVRHLLPRIGSGVEVIRMTHSKGITDQHVRGMLRQCPRLVRVDLSHTTVGELAFKGVALINLEELNLAECRFVTDATLDNIGKGYVRWRKRFPSKLKRLNLSGCRAVTSYGIEKLLIHQPCLEELDLSGVYKIDGETLTTYVEDCPRLVPQKLAYCNDIEDGPWPDLASGCQNLECPTRFCCQKLRN